jgi:alkylated DNA repair dioxygenase AlkB
MEDYIELREFITSEEEKELLSCIDTGEWFKVSGDKGRRVQHYGYKYNYYGTGVEKASPIKEEFMFVKKRLEEYIKLKIGKDVNFDQVIINEYIPPQGIGYHIDHTLLFDEFIVSLSLESDINMNFKKDDNIEEKRLFRRSAFIIYGVKSNSCRMWQHSIPSRLTDVWESQKIKRSRRVSLTFRQLKI